jgi:phospholipid/cholesterol/gamma-HCH transport system permease protein
MADGMTDRYRLLTHADRLCLSLQGDWLLTSGVPDSAPLLQQISNAEQQYLSFDCDQLGLWDTGLMTFLVGLLRHCQNNDIVVDQSALPEGVRKLLKLSFAIPERRSQRRAVLGQPVLAKIGSVTIEMHRSWNDMLSFTGEVFCSFFRLFRGRVPFRRSDLLFQLETAGPSALFIVTLISILVGMILAFVGAIQLRLFGAEIFIANLVGLGMAREMGAMMTAIIMAGRTGAAYAALLGTMQVNEEIDALQTIGVSPIDFLVLPRLIALIITLPLLCIYADFMGILGGAVVSASLFEISFAQYFLQIQGFVDLSHFLVGVAKAAVFGVLIASAGCFRGLQCGRSASAVGFAATSATVTSIVLIIVADAIITVICQVLGV